MEVSWQGRTPQVYHGLPGLVSGGGNSIARPYLLQYPQGSFSLTKSKAESAREIDLVFKKILRFDLGCPDQFRSQRFGDQKRSCALFGRLSCPGRV
jgi:hypothetical protein